MIETHESSIWCSCLEKIDIKLWQIYTNIYIYIILYTNSRFKRIIFRKYTTNLKITISHRSLINIGLLVLLFKFNFSFLMDVIENIINTSVSCEQNSHHYRVTPSVSHDQNKVSGGQKKNVNNKNKYRVDSIISFGNPCS